MKSLEDSLNSQDNRVTIKDVAEALGLSTATVSNVIHGKTQKISSRTVEKVQEMLEKSGYIPNMAAVLLAQNNSKIVCVVLSDDKKYKKKMLEDPFVGGVLSGISKALNELGYFMMLKEESEIERVIQYASMWNMAGLILLGYCAYDYDQLRSKMHIPFVVIDGYAKQNQTYCDIGIDNQKGGYEVGNYLVSLGHRKMMYLSDNDDSCDHERYVGFKRALQENGITHQAEDFKWVPMEKEARFDYYETLIEERYTKDTSFYTATFCASDLYAIEWMNFLVDHGIGVPNEISVVGFDDIPLAEQVRPRLTTVRQDMNQRGEVAARVLDELIKGSKERINRLLPVYLVKRESVRKL